MTQPTIPSHNASAVDSREDPAMRSLFRMSRTAGVGLGDYAAVNVLAVAGLLLAFASVLVLIFADVMPMLLIPAAAIVISLIAFFQIRASNGTQTGRGIAIAGLIVALALAGTNVYGRASLAAAHRRDATTLRGIVNDFSASVLGKRSAAAYDLFDPRFKDLIGLETFDRTASYHVANLFTGKATTGMGLGENIFFDADPTSGAAKADALLFVFGDGTFPDGSRIRTEEPIEFRLVDGQWKIHSITNWFDAALAPKTKPR